MTTSTPPTAPSCWEATVAALEKAKAYVQENFTADVRLATIAPIAGLSPFHFQRTFKRHFGVTPKAMAAALQVEKAEALIRQENSLYEVARACGFATPSHFTGRFKQLTGMKPLQFAKSIRTSNS